MEYQASGLLRRYVLMICMMRKEENYAVLSGNYLQSDTERLIEKILEDKMFRCTKFRIVLTGRKDRRKFENSKCGIEKM
jgi:hypothetical protein